MVSSRVGHFEKLISLLPAAVTTAAASAAAPALPRAAQHRCTHQQRQESASFFCTRVEGEIQEHESHFGVKVGGKIETHIEGLRETRRSDFPSVVTWHMNANRRPNTIRTLPAGDLQQEEEEDATYLSTPFSTVCTGAKHMAEQPHVQQAPQIPITAELLAYCSENQSVVDGTRLRNSQVWATDAFSSLPSVITWMIWANTAAELQETSPDLHNATDGLQGLLAAVETKKQHSEIAQKQQVHCLISAGSRVLEPTEPPAGRGNGVYVMGKNADLLSQFQDLDRSAAVAAAVVEIAAEAEMLRMRRQADEHRIQAHQERSAAVAAAAAMTIMRVADEAAKVRLEVHAGEKEVEHINALSSSDTEDVEAVDVVSAAQRANISSPTPLLDPQNKLDEDALLHDSILRRQNRAESADKESVAQRTAVETISSLASLLNPENGVDNGVLHRNSSRHRPNLFTGIDKMFDFGNFTLPTLPPLKIGGNVEIPLEIPLPQIPADFGLHSLEPLTNLSFLQESAKKIRSAHFLEAWASRPSVVTWNLCGRQPSQHMPSIGFSGVDISQDFLGRMAKYGDDEDKRKRRQEVAAAVECARVDVESMVWSQFDRLQKLAGLAGDSLLNFSFGERTNDASGAPMIEVDESGSHEHDDVDWKESRISVRSEASIFTVAFLDGDDVANISVNDRSFIAVTAGVDKTCAATDAATDDPVSLIVQLHTAMHACDPNDMAVVHEQVNKVTPACDMIERTPTQDSNVAPDVTAATDVSSATDVTAATSHDCHATWYDLKLPAVQTCIKEQHIETMGSDSSTANQTAAVLFDHQTETYLCGKRITKETPPSAREAYDVEEHHADKAKAELEKMVFTRAYLRLFKPFQEPQHTTSSHLQHHLQHPHEEGATESVPPFRILSWSPDNAAESVPSVGILSQSPIHHTPASSRSRPLDTPASSHASTLSPRVQNADPTNEVEVEKKEKEAAETESHVIQWWQVPPRAFAKGTILAHQPPSQHIFPSPRRQATQSHLKSPPENYILQHASGVAPVATSGGQDARNRRQDSLQYATAPCNTLQHTLGETPVVGSDDRCVLHAPTQPTHTRQHAAAHCNALQHTSEEVPVEHDRCALHALSQPHPPHALAAIEDVGQEHTAAHYNTLQHTAAHCNTQQHTATHCDTMHHTVEQMGPELENELQKRGLKQLSEALLAYGVQDLNEMWVLMCSLSEVDLEAESEFRRELAFPLKPFQVRNLRCWLQQVRQNT